MDSMKTARRAKISQVMGEFKRGTLKMGRSGRPVTDRKQAIAIALSEAQRMKKPGRKTVNKTQILTKIHAGLAKATMPVPQMREPLIQVSEPKPHTSIPTDYRKRTSHFSIRSRPNQDIKLRNRARARASVAYPAKMAADADAAGGKFGDYIKNWQDRFNTKPGGRSGFGETGQRHARGKMLEGNVRRYGRALAGLEAARRTKVRAMIGRGLAGAGLAAGAGIGAYLLSRRSKKAGA